MSERDARWIDAALGEVRARPTAPTERGLLESYERAAARAHLALALTAPLTPPRDLRARLVAQGRRLIERRPPPEGAP